MTVRRSGAEAEDGLPSLRADPRRRWISVGLDGVEATPGLDGEVSHIMALTTLLA